MKLQARRIGHVTNGDAYDCRKIAEKAFRLAAGGITRDDEQIEQHELPGGKVRLSETLDYGYALMVTDTRRDVQELHLSIDLDEAIAHYKEWMRDLS